jgi:uncharacterized protein
VPVRASDMLRAPLNCLVSALGPEQVVLFGSHAKGTAHPGSDFDLLVIGRFEGDLHWHLRRARHLVARSFPRVDVVLCTPEDVEDAYAGRDQFLLTALQGGVTVYRRST